MNALHINSEYRTDVTFIDLILVLPNLLFCSLMDTDCTDRCQHHIQQLYVLPQATRLEAAEMNRQWQERFLPVLATWSKIVWANIILQMSFQAKQCFFERNLTIFVDDFRTHGVSFTCWLKRPKDSARHVFQATVQLPTSRSSWLEKKREFLVQRKNMVLTKNQSTWGLWNFLDNSCCL